jgi:C4-dicarboxylate-specific signal transduction histidine kinase
MIFALTFVVCQAISDRVLANGQADALLAVQQGADLVASETTNLLGDLNELCRVSALAVKLSGENDISGRNAAIDALVTAMRANMLVVRSVQLRNASGRVLVEQGVPVEGGPADVESGLSRPWRAPDGQFGQFYTIAVAGHPNWIIRFSFNPAALSAGLRLVIPSSLSTRSAAIVTLARESDGTFVTRSDSVDRILADQPKLRSQYIDLQQRESGAARLVSVVTGVDSLVGYRAIPGLGIYAAVSATTADLMERAELWTRKIQRAPYVVFLLCLSASALTMAWLTRRRAASASVLEKQKAAAQAAAKAELDELVQFSPAMLYRGRLDQAGVYSRDYVTPNSKAVTGWDPDMLSDPERVWKLSAVEDRHLRGTNYARALLLGRSAMDYRFLRPDGGYSWLRNEAVILTRHPDGSADVVGAITNITRERELAAQAALQSRMATLGQLSTSLAHELTQPVSVIGMSAAIARSILEQMSEVVPRDLLAQVDQILDQTDRAGDMIRHLRSYGHADSGPLADVSLELAVSGAMSLAGMPLREAGIEVRLDLQPELPPVRARLVQVEQVLVNLMINARDAMLSVPEHHRHLVITAIGGKTVRLSVSDTGPGVDADAMPRLFEAFYTTKPPGHGTGLGLALCQTMMQSFGGGIVVESGPGGATFTLEFQPAA